MEINKMVHIRRRTSSKWCVKRTSLILRTGTYPLHYLPLPSTWNWIERMACDTFVPQGWILLSHISSLRRNVVAMCIVMWSMCEHGFLIKREMWDRRSPFKRIFKCVYVYECVRVWWVLWNDVYVLAHYTQLHRCANQPLRNTGIHKNTSTNAA